MLVIIKLGCQIQKILVKSNQNMNFSFKKKFYFFLIFFFLIIVFFISLNLLVKSFYFRNLTTHDQKIFIKKFLLPWKGKEDRTNKNFYLEKLNNEINFKKSLKKLNLKKNY